MERAEYMEDKQLCTINPLWILCRPEGKGHEVDVKTLLA
jgi:hypothetical protein